MNTFQRSSLAVFMACMVLFASCSVEVEEPAASVEMEEQQEVVYEGTIEPLEISFGQKGTHKLVMDNGKEVLLESKVINLNMHVNAQMAVHGYLELVGDDMELIDVTEVKELSEEEEQEVVWEDVFSPSMLLELRYPNMFTKQEGGDYLRFEGEDETLITIVVAPLDSDITLEDFVEKQFPRQEVSAATVGKYQGLRVVDEQKVIYAISFDGRAYTLTYSTKAENDVDEKKAFYTMIDTLTLQKEAKEVPEELEEDTENSTEDISSVERVETTTETEAEVVVETKEEPIKEDTTVSEESTVNEDTSVSEETTTVAEDTSSSQAEEEETSLMFDPGSSTVSSDANSTTTVARDDQSVVMAYFRSNVSQVADGAKIEGFSFSGSNYVYVTYTAEEKKYQKLYTYDIMNGSVSVTLVGSFVEGETKDWDKVEGENPTAGKEKVIYDETESGAQKKAEVKEGFRLYDGTSRGYSIQYPTNWYYQGSSGGDGTVHELGFANEPVEGDNAKVSLEVKSGDVSTSGTTVDIDGKTATKTTSTDEEGNAVVTYYMKADDGRTYVLSGAEGDAATLESMLSTLEVKE